MEDRSTADHNLQQRAAAIAALTTGKSLLLHTVVPRTGGPPTELSNPGIRLILVFQT